MTLKESIGCALLVFGPPVAMFTLTIAKNPIRIILLLFSAFFWMLSSIVAAGICRLAAPDNLVITIIVAVSLQELFRGIKYKVFNEIRKFFLRLGVETDNLFNIPGLLGYVSGLGFGVVSGVFAVANLLPDAVGPGTVGVKGESHFFLLISASIAFCIIILHTLWGTVFFLAMNQKNYKKVALVVLSHLLVSFLTYFNYYGIYFASTFPIYAITILTASLTFYELGGTYDKLKSTLYR